MAVMFLVVSLAMFLLYNLIPSDPVRAEMEPMRGTLKPAEYQEMYRKLRAGAKPMIRSCCGMAAGWDWRQKKAESLTACFKVISVSQATIKNPSGCHPRPDLHHHLHEYLQYHIGLRHYHPSGHPHSRSKRTAPLTRARRFSKYRRLFIPIFGISLIFIYFFAVELRWFPVMGTKSPGASFTGWKAFTDKMYYMSLPLIVMTFAALGGMTRYVRAAMIDALSMDYIRTARARCAGKVRDLCPRLEKRPDPDHHRDHRLVSHHIQRFPDC